MSGAQNPFSNEALGFDPDALTKRYAAERENASEKTLKRSSFNSRTIRRLPINISKKTLTASPSAGSHQRRAGGHRDWRWLGRHADSRTLVQAGIEGVRIVESGGDFGGTWYWNRYPGAQCDMSPTATSPP